MIINTYQYNFQKPVLTSNYTRFKWNKSYRITSLYYGLARVWSETNLFYGVARLIPPQYVVSFSCPLHHRKRTFKKRINPYQKSSRRSFALRYINEVYENKKNLSILFWSKIIAFLSQSLFGLVKVCLY